MPSVKVIINCRICARRVYYELSEEEQEYIKTQAKYWPCPVIIKHLDHFLVIHLDEGYHNRGTETSNFFLKHEAQEMDKLTKGTDAK